MLPTTELLLVTAARVQHAEQVIKPNLKAGRIVLCDRYIDATVAYQGFAAGLTRETVMRSHELFVEGLMPDLTILLDCPVQLGLMRSRKRNRATGNQVEEGRFEELDQLFHERVRQGYLEQARQEPRRFEIVRADGTPEEIQRIIAAAAQRHLIGAGYAVS
jgi:dTMP kinase